MLNDRTQQNVRRAAELLAKADALLVTAGAGMGVDSGLPDFRGKEGFWRAYPALGKRGISFERMAQPGWFFEEPETAWTFYGHRQQVYRETKPHAGYRMLHEWSRAMPVGYFVVTSNVDGHFEAVGFEPERTLEMHGNIHVLQCTQPCREATWRDSGAVFDIDLEAFRTRGELPRCPYCGSLARPNVLMFGDGNWVSTRGGPQQSHYQHWLASIRGRYLVIVELGAGIAIPTLRRLGEALVAERARTVLVRINPLASETDDVSIPIRLGALEALQQIEAQIGAQLRARPPVCHAPVTEVAALPKTKVASRGPERLPPTMPTREMEVIEFVGTPDERLTTPVWSREIPKYSDLGRTTFLDLDTGLVEPFNHLGIRTEDEQACLDCWRGPTQDRYAALPEIGEHLAAGYLMTGRAVQLREAQTGIRRGAVIILLCSPEREVILTIGAARWPVDGAALWRWMYETAPAAPKPLEFPRVPWVARRSDMAAAKHEAMLPSLKVVGRVMAWTWLRLHMYYDQMRRSGEGE